MRIGYLGGHKAGKTRVNSAEDFYSKDLEWEVNFENPRRPSDSFQEISSFLTDNDWVKYQLTIFKKDGVMKFFYILEGMSKDEIESQMIKYWDNSDIFGSDFK